MTTTARARALRITLATLLALGALNAFGGAWYGLADARGVPREWLRGSPFADYFIPSLVLGVVVGGSFAVAAFALLRSWTHARALCFAAAAVVLAWIVAQVSIIGFVSWLQPITALAGATILGLATLLPRASSPPHAPAAREAHGCAPTTTNR